MIYKITAIKNRKYFLQFTPRFHNLTFFSTHTLKKKNNFQKRAKENKKNENKNKGKILTVNSKRTKRGGRGENENIMIA